MNLHEDHLEGVIAKQREEIKKLKRVANAAQMYLDGMRHGSMDWADDGYTSLVEALDKLKEEK